jgi:hypothetical protein
LKILIGESKTRRRRCSRFDNQISDIFDGLLDLITADVSRRLVMSKTTYWSSGKFLKIEVE